MILLPKKSKILYTVFLYAKEVLWPQHGLLFMGQGLYVSLSEDEDHGNSDYTETLSQMNQTKYKINHVGFIL